MNIHCLKKHYSALKLRVLTSDLFPNPRIFFPGREGTHSCLKFAYETAHGLTLLTFQR